MAKRSKKNRNTSNNRFVSFGDMVRGAIEYAEIDKSDPFSFGRCMAHIRAGLCEPRAFDGDFHPKGMAAHYSKGVRP